MTRALLMLTLAALFAISCDDTQAPTEDSSAVASVVITAAATDLDIGSSLQLAARTFDRLGTEVIGRSIAWISNDTSVAIVSVGGLVFARRAGSATISARSEGKSGSINIIVRAAHDPVARLEPITGGVVTLLTGEGQQLGFRAFAADGSELFGRTAAWSSANSTIASVNATGFVTAQSVGSADVTAQVEGKTMSIAIDVRSRITSVQIDPASITLAIGEAASATATLRGAGGVILQRPITWSTSNPNVATVDAQGRIVAASAGFATIKATAEGQEGWTHIQVVDWAVADLIAVSDSSLPTTLFTRQLPDGRAQRVIARLGEFAIAQTGSNGGRYQLRIHALTQVDGGVPSIDSYGFNGTWQYDVITRSFVLQTYAGQILNARRSGNEWVVTGQLEAGTAAVALKWISR